MTTTQEDFSLEYVDIKGKGVDAFNRRRERNDHDEINAQVLDSSIEKVSEKNIRGIKMLRAAAIRRAAARSAATK